MKAEKEKGPQWHFPMGTPRRIHVDSTWLLRRYVEDQISTNFHVISAYFFDVISMVEKSTSFSRTFFYVISLVEKSMLFPCALFDVISIVETCTLFLLTFLDVILMGKNSTSFLVSFKLMETFEEIFPVFVTLNSWLLQDCSLWIFQVNLPGVAQFHWSLSLTTSTTTKRTLAS